MENSKLYSIESAIEPTNEIYLTEMLKLAFMLRKAKIKFSFVFLYDGCQIICENWDAICHKYSMGGNQGLIEIMGSIVSDDLIECEESVEGFLTAEEIFNRL